jgi:hypothetical protein
MQSFKTLRFDSSDIAKLVAYDAHTESCIVSGPGLTVVSGHGAVPVSLLRPPPAPVRPSEGVGMTGRPYLHFGPTGSDNLAVSHSGKAGVFRR